MKITKGMIAWTLGAIFVVGGTATAAAIGPIFPIPGNTAGTSSIVEETVASTVTETPTPTPTVAPAVVAPPVAVAPPVEVPVEAPPAALTKCPADTKANSVDDAGNESNCEPLGPSGQQCVAYNDQNECTEYLKP